MAAHELDVGAAEAWRRVRHGVYARLSGDDDVHAAPPPTPAAALAHVAVMLHACDDWLEFEHAERAARDASTAARALDVVPSSSQATLDTMNADFNYALAVDALRAVEAELHAWRGTDDDDVGDGDATCVDEPAPGAQATRAMLARASADLAAERDAHERTQRALADAHAAHEREAQALREASAQQLDQAYADHADELDHVRDAHASELAALAADHEQALAAAAAQHASALRDLAAQHADSEAALQRRADAQHAEHVAELQRGADARVAAVHARAAALEAALATLEQAWHAHAAAVAAVQAQALAADAERHTLRTRLAASAAQLAASARDVAHWERLRAQASESEAAARAALEARDAEASAKQQRLVDAERQLAELQSEVERSVHTQASVERLQQRLAASEADAAHWREQWKSMEFLRAEKAQLATDVDELQKLVSMYKDGVAAAQHEQERTAQELDTLQARYYEATQRLAARDDEVRALREAKRKWADQARAAKAAAASPGDAALRERIAELECELQAKATDIEDADTRLLAAVKENKRLAAQVKALRAEAKRALHDVTNAPAAPRSPTKSSRPVS